MNTYNIITIGCQMNKSDSERIAGYLEKHGYQGSDNREEADLVVVNTCGVRQSAEDRAYGLIPKIKKENPKAKIVLTGCLSERKDVQKRLKGKVDIWLPIKQIPNSKFQITNKSQIPNSKLQSCDYLTIKPKYQSKFSAFVPIGNGCNNFCSYCVVPYARGREVYRPVEDILDEVGELVKRGYKEIILIAQNVNSYKYNANARVITFPDLLQMVNEIKGDFWIRFATSHPKDMKDELIQVIAECEKVCEHVHLPVQAGDNEILKRMNRNYTVEDYKRLVKKIKKAIVGVSITTDAIVGFPGETGKQFNNTVKLFKKMKFDLAYIAQYNPRPGTAAMKLDDDVPGKEKKKREEELMKVLRKTAWENNKKYVGRIIDVLISGQNKKGEWFGKSRTGKNVKIEIADLPLLKLWQASGRRQTANLVGKFVKVKINKARDFGLEGVLK